MAVEIWYPKIDRGDLLPPDVTTIAGTRCTNQHALLVRADTARPRSSYSHNLRSLLAALRAAQP